MLTILGMCGFYISGSRQYGCHLCKDAAIEVYILFSTIAETGYYV